MREPATLTRRALAAVLPIAALAGTAPLAFAAKEGDPVLAGIALHQALRKAVWATSGYDNDPAYVQACKDEEAAIQALGDMLPTTTAGAAAQLAYMAEIEADFADDQSPLLRCVLTVARGLQQIARAA